MPIIVYNYLNAVSQGDKRGSRNIETLLIVIYNIEISNDDDAKPKVISFRMPILAQASVYHEEKSLHPTDLRRWEENSNKTVNWYAVTVHICIISALILIPFLCPLTGDHCHTWSI